MNFSFSVLMAVYYKDDPIFLEQSLKSLYAQSFKATQVVLICDGQLNEDLDAVIARFMSLLPISLVRLESNIGLGNALNIGLTHCIFDWVFRMDSDDISRPNRFEIQAGFILKNPNVGLVGGSISEFIDYGSPIGERIVPRCDSDIRSAMAYYSPLNHVTVAFKKDRVIDVGGYQGGNNFQEDYYLWLKLATTDLIFHNMPNVLVDVRVGDNMLTRRGGVDYFIKELKVSYFGFKNGIIPLHSFLKNLIIKFFLRLSPIPIRRMLYQMGRRYINR